ncbi:MAG: Cytochrome C oxidase subunit III [uncultured Sulfurovum sp.]|uniref:Cytochrome C oxidase subunit III n=1 Tax=uncultured Sulfurovum sp. TaxID=269237 RepID=A0A6S6UDD4_9BACT|nr:MAG: Cytochrome C oxidase subunit III [uncultured Sulfurovum sp.]
MRFIWLFLPILLFSEVKEMESFITEYEYGEMLYNNPRGISCAQCHGPFGEGKKIVHYKENGETLTIMGADIRNKSLNEMLKSIGIYHEVMPRYYLTDDEVKSIYEFLKEKNKK